jgi:hypothetical protein
MEVAVAVVISFVVGSAATWFAKDRIVDAAKSVEARVAAAEAKLAAAKAELSK